MLGSSVVLDSIDFHGMDKNSQNILCDFYFWVNYPLRAIAIQMGCTGSEPLNAHLIDAFWLKMIPTSCLLVRCKCEL